jgi:putative spermidine/putrescine transport system permease protein
MQPNPSPIRANLAGWLYVSPLVLVLVPFFVAPILVVLAASFFATDGFGGLTPGFTLASYVEVLHSALTLKLYLATIKFTVLTWIFTLAIGFFVAYFLVFHVRN